MIGDREQRFLKGFRWRRRAAFAVGLLLALAGGCYGIWGAVQFRSELGSEVSREPAISRWDPLARVALLFAPYQQRLREAEPETEAEGMLLRELDEQTTLTTQLLVLLVRFVFASLILTSGLILVASSQANRRLLSIVDAMLDQEERNGG